MYSLQRSGKGVFMIDRIVDVCGSFKKVPQSPAAYR
ncbi:MAG: hypothetical protein Hyperionvirus4_15 [Hyperionvirus sp.]|uniref:Uncharacterized protein n=1 Tax=Hyperionvirus sp. TaxID=2487770 RepID=A0A3G5A714_9VIRU|nr:MAG: hypothetical protein Hyperionvirus4_15 [Hyperionvirus sp.]